ncbi:hypothetical protein Ccrd_024714, partial [Cynara cardunculus var. scolymus]
MLPEREQKSLVATNHLKRTYICREKACIHHDSLRALDDLTSIKKHLWRKHVEKKWSEFLRNHFNGVVDDEAHMMMVSHMKCYNELLKK